MENKKIGEKTPYHTSTKKVLMRQSKKNHTIELQHIDFTKRYSVTVLQLDSKGYSKQALLYIYIYIYNKKFFMYSKHKKNNCNTVTL